MWTFADLAPGRARPPRLRHTLQAVALVTLAALAATTLPAAAADHDAIQAAEPPATEGRMVKAAMKQKADPRKARGYELRCWQYGRLILEEHYLQPPSDYGSEALRMSDETGKPVRVLETSNATCLLKAASPAPKGLPR